MRWPSQPLERTRRFAPRFCPRRDCAEHQRRAGDGFRFQRCGAYRRADGRRVPRFRCGACGRTFSKQTFATSYYLKRPELLVPVAAGLLAGAAHRQIARSVGCAASTVTRLSARAGRHCLLLHCRALRQLPDLREPIIIDHFETFEFTQDYPVGVALAVGRQSWFVYAVDPCPHARAGRLSPRQRRRLARRPRRPRRGGYAGSFARTVAVLRGLVGPAAGLRLVTDGHADYRRVLRRPEHAGRIVHAVFANPRRGPKGAPRSRAARARDRELFASDLLHLLLRHSLAHFRRETIAFGRRLNAILERLFVAAVWRNFVKGVSERRADPTTPAMRRELTRQPWSWSRVFARRLFPHRERPPGCWIDLYRRVWTTPLLPSNTHHELKLAF